MHSPKRLYILIKMLIIIMQYITYQRQMKICASSGSGKGKIPGIQAQ